jgi:hypothetical protein
MADSAVSKVTSKNEMRSDVIHMAQHIPALTGTLLTHRACHMLGIPSLPRFPPIPCSPPSSLSLPLSLISLFSLCLSPPFSAPPFPPASLIVVPPFTPLFSTPRIHAPSLVSQCPPLNSLPSAPAPLPVSHSPTFLSSPHARCTAHADGHELQLAPPVVGHDQRDADGRAGICVRHGVRNPARPTLYPTRPNVSLKPARVVHCRR